MQDQSDWAPEDVALMLRMAVEGWPLETIADRLSRACEEVLARAAKAGLTLRPPPYSPFIGDGGEALAEAERWRKMTNDADATATQDLHRRTAQKKTKRLH